jgi:hydrogenase-4 component F
VETREIAAVRGLIRRSPVASAALIFGGLGNTGAPSLAVFLSEFSILKAGLNQRNFLVTGLLALFIVVAFFGVMLHINRMVFGAREGEGAAAKNEHSNGEKERQLPFSCRLALLLAALPVLVLGFYIPKPLQDLLTQRCCLDKMNRPLLIQLGPKPVCSGPVRKRRSGGRTFRRCRNS